VSREERRRLGPEDPVAAVPPEAPPGAGAAAAYVLALAAGLVEMVARRSPRWEEAPGARAQALALRARVAPLAQEDADAYARAVAALRRPREPSSEATEDDLGARLEEAAAVPLLIAECGADVAEIAQAAAANGEPDVNADAVGAALLAAAATQVAGRLVDVNLGMRKDDWRRDSAREAATRAMAASDRALADEY
jgi:formiminotetrahydrofolate cyclodeaminase